MAGLRTDPLFLLLRAKDCSAHAIHSMLPTNGSLAYGSAAREAQGFRANAKNRSLAVLPGPTHITRRNTNDPFRGETVKAGRSYGDCNI